MGVASAGLLWLANSTSFPEEGSAAPLLLAWGAGIAAVIVGIASFALGRPSAAGCLGSLLGLPALLILVVLLLVHPE